MKTKMKKREKSNLPVVYDGKTGKVFTPKQKKLMKSVFGEHTRDIVQLIENNNRDGAITMIYKQLMKMLVTVIPVLEKRVRKSKGTQGTYQLNQTISSIRELVADIQSVQDRALLARSIVEKYVRPAFLDIAMQMVHSDSMLETEVLGYISESKKDKVKTEMKRVRQEMGRFIQDQYKEVEQNIMKGLT